MKEVEAKLAEVEANYERLEKEYLSTKQELEHLKAANRHQSVGGLENRPAQPHQLGDLSFLEDVFFYEGNISDQPYSADNH